MCIVAIYAITLHIVNKTEICNATNILKQVHNMLLFLIHKTVSCINQTLLMTKYTDTPNHNSIMPHLERGPSEYSFSTPKNESATPSSNDMMPPYASLAEIKLTSTNVLQNQEHE